MQDDIDKTKELINDSLKKLVEKHWFYSWFRHPNIVEVVDNLVESVKIVDSLPKRLEQEKKEWKKDQEEKRIQWERFKNGPGWNMTREEYAEIQKGESNED
jgi:hypothetical protein